MATEEQNGRGHLGQGIHVAKRFGHVHSQSALGQACLLVGLNNATWSALPESDAPIALHEVQHSLRDLPVTRGLIQGAGQQIEREFLTE